MRKLNGVQAGLPAWPNVWETGPNEFLVEAKHITYNGYVWSRRLLRIAAIAYFTLGFRALYKVSGISHWENPVLIIGIQAMAYWFFSQIFQLPKLLCWLLFRKHTKVHFSKDRITINGTPFNVFSHMTIQFRASEPALKREDCSNPHYYPNRLSLKFRIVEMVYWLELVPIASFQHEKLAHKFAVLLQQAFISSQVSQSRTYFRASPE